MADGNVIKNVKGIIDGDPQRKYIVVSAPGKRYSADVKVTDLLYKCHLELLQTGGCKKSFSAVRARFSSIVKELNSNFDINSVLDETEERIVAEKSEDFTASRGEYLSARIAAEVLGAVFVDAEDVIFFRENGSLDGERSYREISKVLSGTERAVLPGFYGKGANGKVKTFSRGGSDISGAVVARAVNASVYENWTDVSGFLACDPRIVDSPKHIKCISYKELRELSYMGANVLHSESIFPVRAANIPIRIKNTFRPTDKGTEILPISKYRYNGRIVTGIAGKKNFTVIFIEKSLMNAEIGFARKVLSILEKHGICFEHMPSGIDTMSFVIDSEELKHGVQEELLEEIRKAVNPDTMRVFDDIALIATVGHGMSKNVGTSAKLFDAIARAGINVRMIDQGSSELNIIVGVDNDNCERAIRAIYEEFFKKDMSFGL